MDEHEFVSVTHSISQQMIDAYADLSGDFNPIHVDPEVAARSPFQSTIAHGPIGVQPFFLAVAHWQRSETPLMGTIIKITYRAPVRPGDEITCVALEGAEDPLGSRLVAECRNQRGQTVVGVELTRDVVPEGE